MKEKREDYSQMKKFILLIEVNNKETLSRKQHHMKRLTNYFTTCAKEKKKLLCSSCMTKMCPSLAWKKMLKQVPEYLFGTNTVSEVMAFVHKSRICVYIFNKG